jgi:hypothetical protein
VLVGAGLEGEWVRLEERNHQVAIFYAWKQLRCLPLTDLAKGRLF